MQNIQLNTEEYQIKFDQSNKFQLRSYVGSNKNHIYLQHNFASLYNPKTEKIIKTLPSISLEKNQYQNNSDTLFQTQIDIELSLIDYSKINRNSPMSQSQSIDFQSKSIKSFKKIQQINRQNILIAKPSSQYCQICKQTFTDYLKHINHYLHQNKLKQLNSIDNDIQELNSILKRKNQQNTQTSKKRIVYNDKELDVKSKKSINFNEQLKQQHEINQLHSKNYIENQIQSYLLSKKTGSKKRILQNDTCELKIVTVSSKTIETPRKRTQKFLTSSSWDQKTSSFSNIVLQKDSRLNFDNDASLFNIDSLFI